MEQPGGRPVREGACGLWLLERKTTVKRATPTKTDCCHNPKNSSSGENPKFPGFLVSHVLNLKNCKDPIISVSGPHVACQFAVHTTEVSLISKLFFSNKILI